jgi:hypothetical protein
MAQRRDRSWQELLETGMQFTNELVRTSRQRADELAAVFRREVQRQVEVLGLATKDDVDRLERRVREVEKAGKAKTGKKTAKDSAKKGPTKDKAGAKKPSGSS